MLDQELVNGLTGNGFARDFKEIVLTQLGTDTPKIRRGPGTISCNVTGPLQFKLFLTHEVEPLTGLLSSGKMGSVAGKLLDDEWFFRMEATDYNGRNWLCDRLRIDESIWMATATGTVCGEIPDLTMADEFSTKATGYRLVLVIPGKPHIPYDQMEERDGGYTRTELNVDLSDGTILTAHEREGHIIVIATHSDRAVDEALVISAIDGMSIASGHHLQWVYKVTQHSNQRTQCISSAGCKDIGKDRKIWNLFTGHSFDPFKTFVRSYADLCREQPNNYFGYWKKALDAWHAGIVVAALPLSVYVEGVVSEFFPDLMKESPGVINSIDALLDHIKAAPLDQDIVKRCTNIVGHMKGKSVTTALKQLAAEGWFDKRLITIWREVRNKSAHGNDMTRAQEHEKIQWVLDGVLGCLHLFYVLLLIRLNFDAEFCDLSTHGFPRIRLTPAQKSERSQDTENVPAAADRASSQ